MISRFPGIRLWWYATAFLFINCIHEPPPDPPPVELTVQVQAIGAGSVTRIPDDSVVAKGTVVTFQASADSGYVFTGWQGDTETIVNPLALVVNADLRLRAVFRPAPARGMAAIASRGMSFSMGSNDAQVSSLERPRHSVAFTYDYYIGVCEVTQGEYSALMGANPDAQRGYPDQGDSFPVHDITWYEAVLYCNALSKAQGYDTVYAYTSVCATQSCPYVLENLLIRYDRFGFRLPTEAEWEYACRAGTVGDYFWGDESLSTRYAWFFDNSGGMSHPVGKKSPNAFGLYDMAGNAAEWVNDWLEPYPDSSVINPVGPCDRPYQEYERTGERPARGGAYSLAASNLRSSVRRFGPYELADQVRQRGVGFRVAAGAFPAAAGRQGGNQNADTPRVTLDCFGSSLQAFAGTSRIKVVFVQELQGTRNLCCIDFTGSTPSTFVVPDSEPVSCPTISPDGRYVAYSSRGEGYTGTSTVTVRPLDTTSTRVTRTAPGENAFIPRWWTGIGASDTFLIYTDGTSVNVLPAWPGEKTYRRRVSGGAFAGPPSVLWSRGSYHGGLSRDGRFLATSVSRAKVIDFVVMDTSLFYFETPLNGRDDNSQLCNLSISPSIVATDEALMLDFGYSRTSALVGRPYGVHEFIFRCNSKFFTNDHVDAWYEKPSGFESWNWVEYTNHPGYAAAMGMPAATDSARAIFLIDLEDSAYLRIASGPDLRECWIWIDPWEKPEMPDPFFDFGRYDIPVQWTSQLVLAGKMRLLWRRRSNVDVAFFGSSPTLRGIDPRAMPHFTAGNFASFNDCLNTAATLAMLYALPQFPRLKAVCVGLDPGFLVINPDVEPLRLNGLYSSKGYQLDSANGFWRSGLPSAVVEKIDLFDNDSWEGFDTNGYYLTPESGSWNPALSEPFLFDFDNPSVRKNLGALERLCDSAAARGIHVLVIEYPENPAYKNLPIVGRLGPSDSTYESIVAWLHGLEERNAFVRFYDANMGGNHDFTDAEAYDCNHLGPLGAIKMSARVDSVLQDMLSH